MIQLECSNCQTMLSIDDAFAGGVCRCQFCGTIQTVPKPSRKSDQASAAVTSPKALFKRKARIESALSPYNDGLARAIDEMDSFGGMGSSGLVGLGSPSKQGSTSGKENTGTNSSATGSRTSGSSQRRGESAATPKKADGGRHNDAAAAAPQNAGSARVHFIPRPSTVAASVASSSRSDSLRMAMIIAAAVIGALACIGGLWWAFSGGSDDAKTMPDAVQSVPGEPVREVQPTKPTADVELAPAAIPIPASWPTSAPADVTAVTSPVLPQGTPSRAPPSAGAQ